MGRQASDKTMLASERRLVRRLRTEMAEVQTALNTYRFRATKAEQELVEWKKRFDLLLARTPQLSAGGDGNARS